MHPILAEICRNRDLTVRPDIMRKWQRAMREDIQPQLDRLDILERSLADSTPVARPKAKETSA